MRDRLEAQGLFLERPISEYICDDIVIETPCSIAAEIGWFEPFRLGAFSHLNGGFIKNVSIGRYCSFARDVQIGHGGHPVEWLSVSPLQYVPGYRKWMVTAGLGEVQTRPFDWGSHTTIGNDVWLGNHVILKDGVKIGDGAIIGAGAVVTRDVPPYAIQGGAPAQTLRMRYSDALIERALAVRWWDYAMSDFGDVTFDQPSQCFDRIEQLTATGQLRRFTPKTLNAEDLRA
jgi:acetyltransferase-like isoleucine patch superfamily enzyme